MIHESRAPSSQIRLSQACLGHRVSLASAPDGARARAFEHALKVQTRLSLAASLAVWPAVCATKATGNGVLLTRAKIAH